MITPSQHVWNQRYNLFLYSLKVVIWRNLQGFHVQSFTTICQIFLWNYLLIHFSLLLLLCPGPSAANTHTMKDAGFFLPRLLISSFHIATGCGQVQQMYSFKIQFSKSQFHIRINLSNSQPSLSNYTKSLLLRLVLWVMAQGCSGLSFAGKKKCLVVSKYRWMPTLY